MESRRSLPMPAKPQSCLHVCLAEPSLCFSCQQLLSNECENQIRLKPRAWTYTSFPPDSLTKATDTQQLKAKLLWIFCEVLFKSSKFGHWRSELKSFLCATHWSSCHTGCASRNPLCQKTWLTSWAEGISGTCWGILTTKCCERQWQEFLSLILWSKHCMIFWLILIDILCLRALSFSICLMYSLSLCWICESEICSRFQRKISRTSN